MTDPTDHAHDVRFRGELNDGEVVEVDGGTMPDRRSGEPRPTVVVRMAPARAHELAGVLGAWSRIVSVFEVQMPPLATELPLARMLDAGAATLGEPAALRAADDVSTAITAAQRLAATEVLRVRGTRLSALQRVAVVDAAAWWMGFEAGDQLAYALLEAVCTKATTTSHTYLALIAPPVGEAGGGPSGVGESGEGRPSEGRA